MFRPQIAVAEVKCYLCCSSGEVFRADKADKADKNLSLPLQALRTDQKLDTTNCISGRWSSRIDHVRSKHFGIKYRIEQPQEGS